jgi:hypothetical protein
MSKNLLQKIDSLSDKLNDDIKTLFALLENQSDWAFFIQLSAYVELLLSSGIKSHFEEESLDSSFERLPLIDSGFGKTHIAKSVGLITKDHEKFIQRLAEIRNVLAHDFKALDFTLNEYVDSMDKNQKKSFIKQVSYMGEEFIPLYEAKPKMVFILNIVFMSAQIEQGLFTNKKERDLNKLELDCLRELVKATETGEE